MRMNSNTVDLHIPGGESMRLVARLATVGYIASAGLTLDEAEDMKIAVAEALGAVGGERLHVQFSTADGAVEIAVVGDGKGVPREEVESEIARYVLRSLADEVEIEENGAGQIGSIRMKKRLSGGA